MYPETCPRSFSLCRFGMNVLSDDEEELGGKTGKKASASAKSKASDEKKPETKPDPTTVSRFDALFAEKPSVPASASAPATAALSDDFSFDAIIARAEGNASSTSTSDSSTKISGSKPKKAKSADSAPAGEDFSGMSAEEIVRALEGCYYAGGLNKNVVRPERQRLGGVSVESLTPVELLARYFALKQVDPARARLLQQHAEALIIAADSTAR